MFKAFLFVSVVLLGTAGLAQSPASASDQAMVRETVATYLHGLKFNDVASFKKAFLPDARLYFVKKNGSLGQLTQDQWYEGFKASAGKEEQGELAIASVDVSGNAASAKVEEDYPNSHYTDYISLLKLNGEWKIVNKVFFASSKRPL